MAFGRVDPVRFGGERRRRPAIPVLPCPACGDVRHAAGPDGPPQRRCWACGNVWLPGEAPPHTAAALNDPAVRAAIEKLDGRVVRVRGKLRRHGR